MELERHRLEDFIARAAGALSAAITEFHRLPGGAIQENWLLDADLTGGAFAGRLEAVLRTDAPSTIDTSLSRAEEFALLRAALAAGVTVPEPLWLCREPEILGKEFFVMRRIAGVAAPHRLVRDERVREAGEALVGELARELARIHTIKPGTDGLAFLPLPEPSPAPYWVARYRAELDRLAGPHPVLEWGLRWLERHAPAESDLVLCHHDYRTGNYLVEGDRLTAILDWEFAGWSDYHEDIAWFCAKCWRFGANDREAGGIGSRDKFIWAYEQASARPVDPDAVAYWEVMAHVRWAIVALHQCARHRSGEEPSLDMALIGRRLAELEYEILVLTGVM